MKGKITTSKVVTWVIGIFVLLIIASLTLFSPRAGGVRTVTTSATVVETTNSSPLPPIRPELSRELPYDQYNRQDDSIRKAISMRNGYQTGSGFQFAFIGTQENTRCDNCADNIVLNANTPSDENVHKEYLIRLSGWRLRYGEYSDDIQYHTIGDQSYVRKGVYSTIEATKDYTRRSRSEVDVEVPFRINPDSRDVMIPVSKSTMNITFYILATLAVLFLVYVLMFIIGDFIKFMIDVARGNTFTLQNVNRLRFIALNLFIVPYTLFLINLLMPLVFHKYFTEDIKLNPELWKLLILPTILSLIFAALYTAFKKGKQLNDEAELTV